MAGNRHPDADADGAATREKRVLRAALDEQRRHIISMLDGLSEADLRRPVLPSGWSCAGLASHLALDVERFWFLAVVAGDPESIAALAGTENGWEVDPAVPAASVIAEYRRQIERADRVLDGVPLDAEPAWWPESLFGDWRPGSVREVLVHVLTETAAHTGHLDAARELIDGRLWLVLTGE